jgi:hypothetical protein
MPASTESIRWSLLETVERSYYAGAAAGESWLQEVSAFVDSMPRNDRRLIRLAIIGAPNVLRDFIVASPPASGERFAPSRWLDGYVDWAVSLS